MSDEQGVASIAPGLAERLASGWGPAERDGSRTHLCGYYIEEHELRGQDRICPEEEREEDTAPTKPVEVAHVEGFSVKCPKCQETLPVTVPIGGLIWRCKDRAILEHFKTCKEIV
jgi:hypothetical protein